MKGCLFCKIVKKEIDSYTFYNDDKYMAFLTPFPNTKGVTVVIPKKHMNSYIFNIGDQEFSEFLNVVKKVAKHLDKKLGVARTALVFEGTGINHLHAKLYPLHGPKAKKTDIWADHEVFLKEYAGYITTAEGPSANPKDLRKLADSLKG